jgi:hypothetical protein
LRRQLYRVFEEYVTVGVKETVKVVGSYCVRPSTRVLLRYISKLPLETELSFNGSLKVADTTTVTGTFLDRFGGTVETTKGGLPSTALLVSPHPASAADTVIPIAKTLVARNSASSRIISHPHCGRVPKSTALNRL